MALADPIVDPYLESRYEPFDQIRPLSEPGIQTALHRLLDDQDREVAREASRRLDPRTLASRVPLSDLVAGLSGEPEVCVAALRAIAILGENAASAIPAVSSLLASDQRFVVSESRVTLRAIDRSRPRRP